MFNKLALIFLFFLSPLYIGAGVITSQNYSQFIGKHITFQENIPSKEGYKIGGKKLNTAKYIGKTFQISKIELDRKQNLILFLLPTEQTAKRKLLKINTKTNDIDFLYIQVEYTPVLKPSTTAPQNKSTITATKKATVSNSPKRLFHPSNSSDYFDNPSKNIIILSLILILIFGIFIWGVIVVPIKNTKTIHEVTSTDRGEPSEHKLILTLRKAGFPPHLLFHDLYIPVRNNSFAQIDLLMLTSVGIIVFEVKNYSGWIFGRGNQYNWTQVLNYGKDKYRFYNPILQNKQHIKSLQKYIKASVPCFSVIVFYGDCILKDINFIPQNTYIAKPRKILNVIDEILQQNPSITLPDQVRLLLTQAVINGENKDIRNKHINNIREMKGEDRLFY